MSVPLRLSLRLAWARLVRPGRRVIGLETWAISRARGGGSWSVELVLDGERVALGNGAPCEQDLAEALAAWTRRKANALGVPAEVVTGSDC